MPKPTTSILHQSTNAGYTVRTAFSRIVKKLKATTNKLNNHHVHFSARKQVRFFHKAEMSVWVTYDYINDGQYLNETDRVRTGLPILKPSTKRVGVANGELSVGPHITRLPFHQLSHKSSTTEIFTDFPNSLMSVGKTADDDSISVFTKVDVKVYYEEDVLIPFNNKPIIIRVSDSPGRYHIPLQQWQGQLQP